MVSENVEETEKHNKTDRKANTPKTKAFAQFHSVVDTSCAKLHELFSCQKVAHSVIFYVIIFLLLLVLVYIFRKLVSLPNSNGRYHGRKHNNTSTTTTGSRNPNNDSLSTGFPTKWPKLNTILEKFPTNVPVSSEFTSARETKTHIYGAPESGSQRHEYLSNNRNSGENSYYSNNKNKINNPTINSYSSSVNDNFLKVNQQNIKKQTTSNLHASNWISSNYIGSNKYGKTPSQSSGTNNQYDWYAQENSAFKPPDSSWENTWSSVPWDLNSNLRSWPYSGNSGSGLTNVNQKSQDARSKHQSFHRPISHVNNYGSWGSWGKWGQPGSGFGWIKATDNDKENSYKSMATRNWNNYYHDSASGKLSFNNKNAYAYNKDPPGENFGTSNSYRTDSSEISSPYGWNPYVEYWNQTQGWSNLDATNSNSVPGMNSNARGEHNLWNHQTTFPGNGIKSSQETGSSTLQDDNVDERIHRWPLEDNREDGETKQLLTAFTSRKGTNSKGSRKRNRKVTNRKKAKISHHKLEKIANNKKYSNIDKKRRKGVKQYELSNHVKKSVIPHPTNFKSIKKGRRKNRKVKIPKKGPGKHISRKVSRKKKRRSKKRHSKFTQHSAITITHKNRKIGNKQNSLMGKWQRKVHHVKHCKNLQSFESNGKVQLDKKYLHKQRKYKYTVLSCKYIHIQTSRKMYSRHLDDNDADGFNDDNNEDEIPSERKEICRKFWFITNGKIILKKITKKRGSSSYTVLLCRKRDEPQIRKHAKIRTVNHHYQNTLSQLDDDDERTVNNFDSSRIDDDRSNKDFNDDDAVTEREDDSNKGRIAKLTKHRTRNQGRGYQTDDINAEDDDSDNDFQTKKPRKTTMLTTMTMTI